MSFKPPTGLTFHTLDDIPVVLLSSALRRVALFLQASQVSSAKLQLYHDWWQHDGLHFEKSRITFHNLFAMIETPRSIFEATPADEVVFIGVAPEDNRWYLRFRAEWDADDQSIVGSLAVVIPAELSESFRAEIASSFDGLLAEQAAESYYQSVIL
jgi:hypothetical protein